MRYFILLAVLGAAVAVKRNPQRIVGGEATTIEQNPFMANMQYGLFTIWWYQSCGGTLLTTMHILSNGNCYNGDSLLNWKVLLGTSYASSGGTEHQVASITIHEDYNGSTRENDLSIITLSSLAVLSTTVGVARLAGPNYILADGTSLTTIGWGDLEYDGAAPEVLQSVEVYQINQALCAEQYAFLKTLTGYENWPDITDGMLCTGVDDGSKAACTGDAGGPVLHDSDIVVGITSWGFNCGDPGYPDVSTHVAQYTDWILAAAV